jgi:hypothetical protein
MDSSHSYFSAASTNAGLNSMLLSLHCWLLDWSRQVKCHWLTSFTGGFTGLQCSGSGPTLKCHSSASFFSVQQCLDGSKVLVFLGGFSCLCGFSCAGLCKTIASTAGSWTGVLELYIDSLSALLQPKHKIRDCHFLDFVSGLCLYMLTLVGVVW